MVCVEDIAKHLQNTLTTPQNLSTANPCPSNLASPELLAVGQVKLHIPRVEDLTEYPCCILACFWRSQIAPATLRNVCSSQLNTLINFHSDR